MPSCLVTIQRKVCEPLELVGTHWAIWSQDCDLENWECDSSLI
jgi:hypothetical protein